MKWPLAIKLPPWPKVFGWDDLTFPDKLKLMGFLVQAGAGMAMTGFAGYAMKQEAMLKAVWPVFYLGAGALILVGVIVTGFAGLLISRSLEVSGPGGFVFKSQDASAQSAANAVAGMTAVAQAMPSATPAVVADPPDTSNDQPSKD